MPYQTLRLQAFCHLICREVGSRLRACALYLLLDTEDLKAYHCACEGFGLQCGVIGLEHFICHEVTFPNKQEERLMSKRVDWRPKECILSNNSLTALRCAPSVLCAFTLMISIIEWCITTPPDRNTFMCHTHSLLCLF